MAASWFNVLRQVIKAQSGTTYFKHVFSPHVLNRCVSRAYGTGNSSFRKKFLSSHLYKCYCRSRAAMGYALLAGGGIGIGCYHSLKLSTTNILAEETVPAHTEGTGQRFTLYQYKTCPHCIKVRSFLDYYGLPYDTVEVNPVLRTEINWSEYQDVPILMVEGKESVQLNESSVIISAIKTCMIDKGRSLSEVVQYFPRLPSIDSMGQEVMEYTNKYWVMLNEIEITLVYPSKDSRKEEVRWRQWADVWLLNLVKPNIYRSPAEALASYKHIIKEGNFGPVDNLFAAVLGAFYMFWVSKFLKIWYRLQDDVREDLYIAVNEWITAVGKKRKFMGGDNPNLADLAVYGVLKSMEGLEAFDDLMDNTKVKKWYQATEREVQKHGGQSL